MFMCQRMRLSCVPPCVFCILLWHVFLSFFFNDTATTEIYTLSLHDALPISQILFPLLFVVVSFSFLYSFLEIQELTIKTYISKDVVNFLISL